ncbi:MAG: STAS domain-containing protein [Solirubrobacterales bacterium]
MPTVGDTEVRDGPLVVHQIVAPDSVRLTLHGELDLSNAKTAELTLAEAFSSGKKVIVDLGKLDFLDSTGVSLLVLALGRPDAGKLSFLPSASPEVSRLLEMTELDVRMGLGRDGENTAGPAA